MARTQYDEKMFEAAREGNHEFLVFLLITAQPDLRRYAAHACRTSDDVNDAVQEALWIVCRRIGALRAFMSLSGWLFDIARRKCVRFARRFWEASFRSRASRTSAAFPPSTAARTQHRPGQSF